jgi:hypothetical protein
MILLYEVVLCDWDRVMWACSVIEIMLCERDIWNRVMWSYCIRSSCYVIVIVIVLYQIVWRDRVISDRVMWSC